MIIAILAAAVAAAIEPSRNDKRDCYPVATCASGRAVPRIARRHPGFVPGKGSAEPCRPDESRLTLVGVDAVRQFENNSFSGYRCIEIRDAQGRLIAAVRREPAPPTYNHFEAVIGNRANSRYFREVAAPACPSGKAQAFLDVHGNEEAPVCEAPK